GANRLGGNGVAESTVYGARVGDFVAGWVNGAATTEPNRDQIMVAQAAANRFVERNGGENPFRLREELGKLMWEKVGIVRDGAKLNQALGGIANLAKRAEEVSGPGGRRFNL